MRVEVFENLGNDVLFDIFNINGIDVLIVYQIENRICFRWLGGRQPIDVFDKVFIIVFRKKNTDNNTNGNADAY